MSDSQVPAKTTSTWTTAQAYVLAVICFALGVPTGYLFHGGQSPAAAQPSVAVTEASQAPVGGGTQVTSEQVKHMADKQAEPVLAQLKSKPNDPVLLAQAGNIYYDAQQYPEAVKFYESALKTDAKNPNIRTDLGTAYFYMGDPDRAIAELNTSLQYDPKHAQTLLNLGLIKWQAHMDVNGAVTAWQHLLDTNPNFEQAEQVKKMIAQAKRHSGMKPGTKTDKPM